MMTCPYSKSLSLAVKYSNYTMHFCIDMHKWQCLLLVLLFDMTQQENSDTDEPCYEVLRVL